MTDSFVFKRIAKACCFMFPPCFRLLFVHLIYRFIQVVENVPAKNNKQQALLETAFPFVLLRACRVQARLNKCGIDFVHAMLGASRW